MIYPIITIPDKVLRKKSDAVDKVDGEILSILENMAETMYAALLYKLVSPEDWLL